MNHSDDYQMSFAAVLQVPSKPILCCWHALLCVRQCTGLKKESLILKTTNFRQIPIFKLQSLKIFGGRSNGSFPFPKTGNTADLFAWPGPRALPQLSPAFCLLSLSGKMSEGNFPWRKEASQPCGGWPHPHPSSQAGNLAFHFHFQKEEHRWKGEERRYD